MEEKLETKAEEVFKTIAKLILPVLDLEKISISSKIDERGLFILIKTQDKETASIIIGKKGRNITLLRKCIKKWASYYKKPASIKMEKTEQKEEKI